MISKILICGVSIGLSVRIFSLRFRPEIKATLYHFQSKISEKISLFINIFRQLPVFQGQLDNKLRRWLQNPGIIVRPYLNKGTTVLDVGCGPGFFTIDMAKCVGKTGTVIAADLQKGMLEKIKRKINGTEIEDNIVLHQCGEKNIGIEEPIDFALAFYMVHETPDVNNFFEEVHSILKDGGKLLVVEPKFHVSGKAFKETISIAVKHGLKIIGTPKNFFSRAVLFRKNE